MLKRICLVAALALTLPAVAGSVNKSKVIQGNAQIGSYKLRIDPTLQGAIEIFGSPTRKWRPSGAGAWACRTRWAAEGISMYFYNLGGEDACKPQYGNFGSATITGKGWRTAKGLRIGDTRRKMTSLYEPRHWYGQWATLLSRITHADCSLPKGCLFPMVEAKIVNGRVAAFRVNYLAGGV